MSQSKLIFAFCQMACEKVVLLSRGELIVEVCAALLTALQFVPVQFDKSAKLSLNCTANVFSRLFIRLVAVSFRTSLRRNLRVSKRRRMPEPAICCSPFKSCGRPSSPARCVRRECEKQPDRREPECMMATEPIKQRGRVWNWLDERLGLADLERLAKKKQI